MSRNTIVALTLTIVSVVTVAVISTSRGVCVIVQNHGPESISDVAIHVTGNEYYVGVIKPGRMSEVPVKSTGDSHVEITFIDCSGIQHRLIADCYFEARNYQGTITVYIAGNKISSVDEAIETAWF